MRLQPDQPVSRRASEVRLLAQRLLTRAGLAPDVRGIVQRQDGTTNRNWVIELENGSHYVLRQYRWPHAGPDLHRLAKEVFLHRLLREQSVPVADILVVSADDGAVLMRFVPGELLGDLARRAPPRDCLDAWHAAGAALRRAHAIVLGGATSGVIVGMNVRPFEAGSWGQFHAASVLRHAERLAAHRVHSIRIDLNVLRDLMEAALPLLDDVPLRLLHNDAHPWNVLVSNTGTGWICSAWLDWEYAWVGDPTWDLVRMDLFRPKPLPPTPPAFYQGYGAFPAEPYRSLYELHVQLWMAADYFAGGHPLLPTYEAALRYVGELDERVSAIHDMVGT